MGLLGAGAIGDDSLTGPGITMMMAVAFVSFLLAAFGSHLGRRDGIILLGLYVAAMVVLISGADMGDDDEVEAPPAAAVAMVPEVDPGVP